MSTKRVSSDRRGNGTRVGGLVCSGSKRDFTLGQQNETNPLHGYLATPMTKVPLNDGNSDDC